MNKKPIVILIGAGRFGVNHLRVLKSLENEGKITLKGVVTATRKSHKIIKQFGAVPYTALSSDMLRGADAVDVVTPASTHYKIINRCLDYTNVLSEKPLALSSNHIRSLRKKADKKNKILMVGHIFKYNDALKKLKVVINKRIKDVKIIEGVFVGGVFTKDAGALETFMHIFYIMNDLLGTEPRTVFCKMIRDPKSKKDVFSQMLLDYGGIPVIISVGWKGNQKERSVTVKLNKENIKCDIVSQKITFDNGKIGNYYTKEPLRMEIEHFVELINGRNSKYPNANDALSVQRIIEAAKKSDHVKEAVRV